MDARTSIMFANCTLSIFFPVLFLKIVTTILSKKNLSYIDNWINNFLDRRRLWINKFRQENIAIHHDLRIKIKNWCFSLDFAVHKGEICMNIRLENSIHFMYWISFGLFGHFKMCILKLKKMHIIYIGSRSQQKDNHFSWLSNSSIVLRVVKMVLNLKKNILHVKTSYFF